MRARRLSPTARMLLFTSIGPDDLPKAIFRMAAAAEERVVSKGEVLLHEDQPMTRFWFAVDAGIQRSRNGVTFEPYATPSPVGLIELLSQGTTGTRLEVVEDGLVLEVDGESVLQALLDSRSSILALMTKLGFAVSKLGTLLPRAEGVPLDVAEVGEFTLVDRLILLGTNGLLSHVPLDVIAPFARRLEPVHLAKGERLFTQGQPTGFGAVVARGSLDCIPHDGESAVAHVGATIGFMDHVVYGAPTFDAVARQDCIVLTSTVETFLESMETHPDLARAMIAGLASALVDVPVLIEARSVNEQLEAQLAALENVA